MAGRTGLEAGAIRVLARDFAKAPSAVAYGRVGTCTQEFGGLASWLVNALNLVTGNVDRPGGAMFPLPAVDLVAFADRIGQRGHFDKGRSRVRGLPEFGGEWPAAVLAEEIETEGPGQIRALVTSAGNPVLSTPNGARLSRALDKLDFMVSIDLYLNETSRHAHLILPPTFALERSHYDLVFHALAVRNTAKFSHPLFPAPPGAKHDWQILLELATRLEAARGTSRWSVVAQAPFLFFPRSRRHRRLLPAPGSLRRRTPSLPPRSDARQAPPPAARRRPRSAPARASPSASTRRPAASSSAPPASSTT